jgi:hypothetical protein
MTEDIDMESNERMLMNFIDGTGIQSKEALAITKGIKNVQQLWLLTKMAKDARHYKL